MRGRQHLVEDESHRELIGPQVGESALRLFRRHVGGCPEQDSRCGRRTVTEDGFVGRVRISEHRFAEAEVQNLHATLGRHHDVRRLQIAMDDAGGMRLRQPIGELPRKLGRA